MECCWSRSKIYLSGDNTNITDDKLCCICYVNIKTHICIPCGHKCLCETCTKKITKTCPICKQQIFNIIKVYE